MIGYSDGSQYDSEFEAMLGPINTEPSVPAGRGPRATEKPAGEFKVDRGYNVPLIAAKTPDGIAIDHRVSTDMDFEGKTHDITPFLIVHENAEIQPMEAAIKSGMEPKKAYELAHDKVANPAEAAVRNAYAIHNGLDVDKFNEAYWSHINTQKEIAAQPSDRERHPDAHTTRYGLDPGYVKSAANKDIEGSFLKDMGWDTLSKSEQKYLEEHSIQFYRHRSADEKELNETINKNGAIYTDPKDPVVNQYLQHAPSGIERYDYKGLMFLKLPPLTS